MATRTRARVTPAPSQAAIMKAAIRHGKRRAAAVAAARRQRRKPGKGLLGTNGTLLAEGDSWFDYPFYDVLEMLEDHFDFRVESVAHKGDTIEEMAYDPTQLSALERKMEHLHRDGRMPRAILVSGGGNDIAGEEFAILLNHNGSGLPILNTRIVEGVVNERLRFAVASVVTTISELSKQHFGKVIPIVVHGYAHPVPDGRGYLGGFWALPGPWLEPGFRKKGHTTLSTNARVMTDLIDRFNAMLAGLPSQPGFSHVTYLDLRGALSSSLAGGVYKKSWENELHPTQAGFKSVARALNDVLLTL
jgi:lysophospholipase L1-like esterase